MPNVLEWELQEKQQTDKEIFEQDYAWLQEAECVVAEVTQPSLGVGIELGFAYCWGKKVLCLFRPEGGKILSAMITGTDKYLVKNYLHVDEGKKHIDEFLASVAQP